MEDSRVEVVEIFDSDDEEEEEEEEDEPIR